jgi:uncharacterized membrane protein YkvA (DUF1232 family)
MAEKSEREDRERGRGLDDDEAPEAAPRRRQGPTRARRRPAEPDDEGDVRERPLASSRRVRDLDEEDEDDLVGPRRVQAPRLRRGSRQGSERETLKGLVRDIPNFLKLLARLARDPRVSAADKAIVVGAVAYVLVPSDVIPEWVPFAGEIDDAFILAVALGRLLNNAGVEVLLDHWDGEVSSLETALALLDRAGSFLPERIRALLGRRAFA